MLRHHRRRSVTRLRKYQGSCHCGRVKFEIEADVDHVRVCDCSICSRRGALIHRVAEESFNLLTPIEELTVYQWGSRTAKDYFCPNCGILPFRRPGALTDGERAAGKAAFSGWAVNTSCIDGLDLSVIARRRIHGSRL